MALRHMDRDVYMCAWKVIRSKWQARGLAKAWARGGMRLGVGTKVSPSYATPGMETLESESSNSN